MPVDPTLNSLRRRDAVPLQIGIVEILSKLVGERLVPAWEWIGYELFPWGMAMDRIDCLRAFVRALEGGSFSAAAAELGIGQPAVSRLVVGSNSGQGSQ